MYAPKTTPRLTPGHTGGEVNEDGSFSQDGPTGQTDVELDDETDNQDTSRDLANIARSKVQSAPGPKTTPGSKAKKRARKGPNKTSKGGQKLVKNNDIHEFPFVAWTPDQSEAKGTWSDISFIPGDVWTEVQAVFQSVCKNQDARLDRYGRMMRNPESYSWTKIETCLGRYIMTHANGTAFKKSDGDTNCACDSCLNAKRPCIRFIKDDTVIKMGIYPVTEGLRDGVAWGAKGTWISLT